MNDRIQRDDGTIIAILKKREGALSVVKLFDGAEYKVWNISWGYDLGENIAHITTNVSPQIPDQAWNFFHTSDVMEIRDADSNTLVSFKPDNKTS